MLGQEVVLLELVPPVYGQASIERGDVGANQDYRLAFEVSGLNYLLLFFATGFFAATIIFTLLCFINLFHKHPKIIPTRYPTAKVKTTRIIPFVRVAVVRVYTGWIK